MPARWIVAAVAASCALPYPARCTQFDVSPSVQVSGAHPADVHYEVCAAIDPRNSLHLIAASFRYAPDGRTRTVIYASTDGGKTWRASLDSAALDYTGDPSCAYGPDGAAYYTASLLLPSAARDARRMLLFRSPDGGATWDPPDSLTYTDRESLVVDTTGGPHNGRIYVVGSNRIPRGSPGDVVAFYSTDRGRTFAGPGKRPGFGQGYQTASASNAAIAADGTMAVIFPQSSRQSSEMHIALSTDGGASLTAGAAIAPHIVAGARKGAAQNNLNEVPALAIDCSESLYRNRVYAAWVEGVSGRGQIYFAWSADLGKTWSKARAINDNPPGDGTSQFMPSVAVNRDGVVAVTWYDRRNHPDNLGWDVRLTASPDGGETFAPSVPISTGGMNFREDTYLGPFRERERGVTNNQGRGQHLSVAITNFLFMGGDYAALLADSAGKFHAFWVDNHSGTGQIWTAVIGLAPGVQPSEPARPHSDQIPVGAPRTAAPPREAKGPCQTSPPEADLSHSVALELWNITYDRKSGLLTATARLRNTSGAPSAGPFRVTVTRIDSELGDAAIEDAENACPAVGAQWTFGDALLDTGALGAPKTVSFRLSGGRPFADGRGGYRLTLLTLELQVDQLPR